MERNCPTCGDAITSDVCYRCSPNFERLASPDPAPPASGSLAFTAIGGVIFVVGVLLLIGNMTGYFPTFPFAGFVFMLIGGWVSKLG